MGLLDWFRRPRRVPITVWLEEAGRWRGFARDVGADLEEGHRVLVVAHFKQALIEAGQQLAAAGTPFSTRARWTDADTRALLDAAEPTVTAVLATALPVPPEGTPPAQPSSGVRVSVRQVDLHPLDPENQRVLRFRDSLPAKTSLDASVSFDHPIMRVFARDWVKLMMQRMGLQPDQPIRSPIVSRSVHRALAKLTRKATGNIPCDSIDEWMTRNLQQ